VSPFYRMANSGVVTLPSRAVRRNRHLKITTHPQ